jgi:hypothetical protein
MNLHTQGPPRAADARNGPIDDQLGGVIEAENEPDACSRQAVSSASVSSLDAAEVEIEDINERIRAANEAIQRAANCVSEANEAIAEANSLIEEWSDRHSDAWPIDPIDEVDEPCEIEEIDEVEVD